MAAQATKPGETTHTEQEHTFCLNKNESSIHVLEWMNSSSFSGWGGHDGVRPSLRRVASRPPSCKGGT